MVQVKHNTGFDPELDREFYRQYLGLKTNDQRMKDASERSARIRSAREKFLSRREGN